MHALENGLPFPFGTVESARWDFGVDNDAETLPGLEAPRAFARRSRLA